MSDQADIDDLLSGRSGAWRAFVERYAPVIYAAVRKRLVSAGREGDVEDVAQEVFVKLCARDFTLLRRFDPEKARLTTWLTVIASSTSIDHLRRTARKMTSIDDVGEQHLSIPSKEPAWVTIPEGLLSPRQALVIQLLYQHDMTATEVGEKLGIDAQTVRSMHHKALQRLRARLADEGK
ncbi:MAG: sigma-70 family RNA polymerase sigma factor [Pseudomonadota bacterium]